MIKFRHHNKPKIKLMTFKEYLKKYKLNKLTFAKKNGISQASVYRIFDKNKNVSQKMAELIEEKTNGEVSRAAVIWPDIYG